MRLGINGWRIHGRRTGVGRYLFSIVRHWTPEVVSGGFSKITFYTPRPIDRQEIPLPENIEVRVVGPNWQMLVWENLRFAPAAGDDVLFCPSYSRPIMARGRPVVVTYETTAHLYPKLYPRSSRLFYDRLYGWSARHAALVVTTTEAAKRDIVRCYGVPPSKIRVVPLAPADGFRPVRDEALLRRVKEHYLGAAAPFFLYVGKLTTRRNVPKLLEAFALLKRRASLPHKLLVVGLNTTNLDLPALADSLGVAGDVRHVEYVPDADLNLIYNGAEAFVMPYTYEAVSLTTLEAQAVGTPVITTDTPGLRENTGGAALFISRAEAEEIAAAMSRLLQDRSLRQELSEKGLAHAQRFSWKRCAEETIAVLSEAGRAAFAPVSASAGAPNE